MPTGCEELPDVECLPAGPGVVCIEAGERCALIAATADARAFTRRRLIETSSAGVVAQADLRPIATCVGVVAVHSAFEAEWVYLTLARERLPHIYRAVAERWRAWFVHIDPDAEFPRFAKTHLGGDGEPDPRRSLVAPRSAGTLRSTTTHAEHNHAGLLLGPLRDKDTAGRFIEAIVDGFDLCRFHNVLVQAPHGAACAYKEMGRCPAPCDGSESMAAYRERVRESVSWIAGQIDSDGSHTLLRLVTDVEQRMIEASGAGKFEVAAALRDRGKRLSELESKRFSHIRTIERCRWLIVQRSAQTHSLRAMVCLCGIIEPLGDFDATNPKAAAHMMYGGAQAASDRFTMRTLTREMADNLGLLSRWLHKPTGAAGRRSAGVFIPIDRHADADAAGLPAALRSLIRAESKGEPTAPIEDQELGMEPA